MKFGVGLPTGMEGLINPVPFFEPGDFLVAAQKAEELGYDSVWGNDHYAAPRYVRDVYTQPPAYYEVLTVLSALSAGTTFIELGTAVLVLPMRDVVTVARQVSTLDQLSGGRLLLGVGIGAYREEYTAARPDIADLHRGELLDDGLSLLTRLLTLDEVTYDGPHYAVDALQLHPKPLRRPFPLLVGGHQVRSIDRAIAHGEGWIPGWRPFDELRQWISILRRRAEEAGRSGDAMIVAPQFSCLVGRTQEEAEGKYRESGMVRHRQSLAYTGRDPELAITNNLVGSPDQLLESLDFLHAAGVNHLACTTFCVNSVSEYFEQLHWFQEEVVVPFRREHGVEPPASPRSRSGTSSSVHQRSP